MAEFDILYGKGISKSSEILEIGINKGIIEKSGAWISYEGTRLGQGRDNARNFIESDAALMAELEAKIKASVEAAEEEEPLDMLDDEDDELDIRLLDLDGDL